MFTSPFIEAVLCGFIMAAVAGVAVARRASNRRIRSLSLALVLMTLCQVCSIEVRYLGWRSVSLSNSVEILQLVGCALALALVYLLSRENRDRSNVDIRLRLFESDLAPAKLGSETPWAPSLKIEEAGTLRILSLSNPVVHSITSVDMSEYAVRVRGPQSIPNRSTVQVDLCGVHLVGKVAQCLPGALGFTICILLDTWVERDVLDSMLRFHEGYMHHQLTVPAV